LKPNPLKPGLLWIEKGRGADKGFVRESE